MADRSRRRWPRGNCREPCAQQILSISITSLLQRRPPIGELTGPTHAARPSADSAGIYRSRGIGLQAAVLSDQHLNPLGTFARPRVRPDGRSVRGRRVLLLEPIDGLGPSRPWATACGRIAVVGVWSVMMTARKLGSFLSLVGTFVALGVGASPAAAFSVGQTCTGSFNAGRTTTVECTGQGTPSQDVWVTVTNTGSVPFQTVACSSNSCKLPDPAGNNYQQDAASPGDSSFVPLSAGQTLGLFAEALTSSSPPSGAVAAEITGIYAQASPPVCGGAAGVRRSQLRSSGCTVHLDQPVRRGHAERLGDCLEHWPAGGFARVQRPTRLRGQPVVAAGPACLCRRRCRPHHGLFTAEPCAGPTGTRRLGGAAESAGPADDSECRTRDLQRLLARERAVVHDRQLRLQPASSAPPPARSVRARAPPTRRSRSPTPAIATARWSATTTAAAGC